MITSEEVVGHLRIDPKHPERWTLFRPSGTVSNRFAIDETREQVAEHLARHGLLLRNDDSVVRAP